LSGICKNKYKFILKKSQPDTGWLSLNKSNFTLVSILFFQNAASLQLASYYL